MKAMLITLALVGTSAFAFEPLKGQVCVIVQRECQPDVKDIANGTWYLAADCSVRVVKQSRYRGGDNIVTDMKPEPKYVCTTSPEKMVFPEDVPESEAE